MFSEPMNQTSFVKFCYQCDLPVSWLAPDGRCWRCTNCSVDDVTGGDL